MTTSEERMKILKMIEDGKLGVDEGARLLAALGGERSKTGPGGRSAGTARWLRVRVTDMATGRARALVQIPIGLIEAGLKIGAHFAPEVEGVDMTNVMDAIRSGMTGKIVDAVDEKDGEHVEIFVE